MNQPINFIDNDKVEIFNQLHAHQVRYLAFGSFSINAYEQARTDSTIKLWVDPAPDNIDRLNRALHEAGKSPLSTNIYSESRRVLKMSSGESTRDTVGVDFYPSINGFEGEAFRHAYERKDTIKAVETMQSVNDQALKINHLSMPDLYHNTGHTNGKAKEYNLQVLYKAAAAFHKEGFSLAEPITYLTMEKKNKKEHRTEKALQNKPFIPQYEKRDFARIRSELDMEVVLQHYGYQLSSKSKPNDVWRVYKSGISGDSQRFAVMTSPKSGFKGFVDLNNTSLKGDVFEFIKYKEGDFKRAFLVVDELLGSPGYLERAAQVAPMAVATPRQYLNDEKLRQSDLIESYGISFLSSQHSDYLTNSRKLDPEIIQAPEFRQQVLNVKKGGHVNVAFPLTSEKGNILSLDIRNKDFKSFPPGLKGDAIWKSNEHALLIGTVDVTIDTRKVPLDKGTRGTLSETNGKLTFHTHHPQEGNLSVPVDKNGVELIPTNRILISESPIDSISYHQLSPPQEGEYRQYISPAGNPSKEQQEHVARFVSSHPEAQFIIAMDGNPAGNRFAINLLATKHPLRNDSYAIHPHVVYNNPTPATGEGRGNQDVKEVGYNLLTLEIKHPMGNQVSYDQAKTSNVDIVERLLERMNLFQPQNKLTIETRQENLIEVGTGILRTVSEIKFPNEGKLLEKSLDQLTDEIARRDGRQLVAVLRPTAAQNDFNDVLQSRNGKSLPDSSNLSLHKFPLESFYKLIIDHKEGKKETFQKAKAESHNEVEITKTKGVKP